MLKLFSQPLDVLARVLRAVAHIPEAEPATLAKYVGLSAQVVTKALDTLTYLALVMQSGSGFTATDRSISRSTPDATISAAVRKVCSSIEKLTTSIIEKLTTLSLSCGAAS